MILNLGSFVKDRCERKYILDQVIGHGGFGYVFKAHRENDNAVFAVKTMLPSFKDEASELAFRNEIQSAMKVQGENVIRYEYVHNGEIFTDLPPYIIMEYADGGTLTSLLEQKRAAKEMFTLDELLCIFKQLAIGMRNISATLVHRDIKPDNILLCEGNFKISDFGLAKMAAEDTRTKTFKGGGTALYMAPEAWDFTKNTIQMDIYSMGIVFYELASLRYPYDPLPRSTDECKNAHLYSSIVKLERSAPQLPASLISVINRMLEKAAKRRFSNWDEIITALGAPAKRDSPIDRLVASAISVANAHDSARQAAENAKRQREKEKADFCKLVHAQFESTIVALLIDFVETFNQQYAGEKIVYTKGNVTGSNTSRFYWRMNIPASDTVTISMEILLRENHCRKISVDSFWGEEQTRMEHYIPKYRGKNILAWGEIKNTRGFGFNILLTDGGEGEIYGDWFIMNNKNNLSYGTARERPEPFPFSIDELPSEIDKVQITHLYSADFIPFDGTQFLAQVQQLAFPPS